MVSYFVDADAIVSLTTSVVLACSIKQYEKQSKLSTSRGDNNGFVMMERCELR